MQNAQHTGLAGHHPLSPFSGLSLWNLWAPPEKAEKLTSFECHLGSGSPFEIGVYCLLKSVCRPQVRNKGLLRASVITQYCQACCSSPCRGSFTGASFSMCICHRRSTRLYLENGSCHCYIHTDHVYEQAN